VPKIAEVIGEVDDNTYFVGHSMGCQAIARFIETLPENIKIGGAVFVASFFKRLTGLEDDLEVKETCKLWLEAPINFNKLKFHMPKSVAIFSDNDLYVPLDNQEDFKEKLGSEIVIEHNMGHFSGSQGVKELPIVLKKLLEFSES